MAIPKPEKSSWLKAAADELRIGDRETLKLLQESYRNINQILKGLPDTPDAAFGNLIYRSQLERTRKALLEEQSKLFDRLGDKVSARRLRSASRAAKLSAAADAALLRLVGLGDAGQRLYDGATITAQRTVETLLARMGLSKVPLAERIYRTSVWMNGRLDRLITQTMATGLNARRFAKVARDWFSPSVPGGTRYAAYRLARTEINNAFHATSVAYAADKPWVSSMDWNLSKSHPKPDVCNEYAAASPWPVAEVPRKPHPQCMCYVTETEVSEDDWIDRFVAGEFDDYLDAELAKSDVPTDTKAATSASGAPVQIQKAKAPKQKKVAPPPPKPTFDERLQSAKTGSQALLTAYFGLDRKLGSPNYNKMEREQRRGVNQYTSNWYQVINRFLRQGDFEHNEDRESTEEFIAGVDAAMDSPGLSAEALVYRGMHNAQKIFGDRIDGDMTGLEWQEVSFVSTTAIEGRTRTFLAGRGAPNRVLMRILVPKGTKAVEASPVGAEAELLINRNTKYRVVRDNGVGEDGIRRLDVEVF